MPEPSLLSEPSSQTPPAAQGDEVRVRLLARWRGHPPFTCERVSLEQRRASPPPSGWIERQIVAFSRKLDALSTRWSAQQEKLPAWARRLLDRVQGAPPPAEELLRWLCSAESVSIEYPADWRRSRAERRWRHLLRLGRTHHLIRALIWALLIPPSLLLVLLPGPNVIGFWFTYRALTHSLAWLGAGRALKGRLPVRMESPLGTG